jgi:hypothetical protein
VGAGGFWIEYGGQEEPLGLLQSHCGPWHRGVFGRRQVEGIAVFIDTTTRDTVRLRTGEGHSGWILQSIERRTATLQKGDRTETLALPKPTDTPTTAPVICALPPPPPPPPTPQAGASAPASGTPPQAQGCMPEPIGC